MVFASPIFLYLFLPAVLAGYAIIGRAGRLASNLWLLVASIFFYAWGEKTYTLVMLCSMLGNYAFGLVVDRARRRGSRRGLALGAAIFANLALLVYFKYWNFLVGNLNQLLGALNVAPFPSEPIHLPIGISFFTFHALTYVVDVWRGDAPVQKNPVQLTLYLSLFPQLVAGPIVRYGDVAKQLSDRRVTLTDFEYGSLRFASGLAKKVLIANTVADYADRAFALPAAELTVGSAWLGVLCYTLQIYFDFSGYSDMAIGLGRMFGFHFLENFAHPYRSRSIKEFWRRWHISLSTFFRDYVYIPLGGNQGGRWRTHFNLVTVFLLCGLWHGASWTFVIWGVYHGSFLILERGMLGRVLARTPNVVQHAYTVVVVMIGWVFFRADTPSRALGMVSRMVGFGPTSLPDVWLSLKLTHELEAAVLLGVILSFPIGTWIWRRLGPLDESERVRPLLVRTALGIGTLALMLLCSARLASGTYNPFIYFQF